ncbi:MAG: UDP-N-acetylglucosamine--N-acetylmuramyl-(pentapeptide) pyrophosphoryl-undecaprenol N-acetylglucosamine transferase [Planctomycetota bacterium]
MSGRAVEQAYMGPDRATASLAFDTSRWPRPMALFGAALRARRHARRFRPDAVIALGGAASAASLGVPAAPLVLLEGNYVVGRSVRWMAGFSALIMTMFEDTAKQMRRAVAIGPVTRGLAAKMEQREARRALGLEEDRPTLVVMGGSQGAAQLNDLTASLLPQLSALDWQVLAICGPGKKQDLQEAAVESGTEVVVLEHCAQMGQAYSAADFALTRGGASTVGELWLHGLPAAILPYPWHKDRQQEHNARALEPGLLCLEGEDPVAQAADVLRCLTDTDLRAQMQSALQESRPPDGQDLGVTRLEEIATRNA